MADARVDMVGVGKGGGGTGRHMILHKESACFHRKEEDAIKDRNH